MASPLKQLNETLKIRRYVQRQIEKLDSLLAEGTITQGHYDATMTDYRSRLKAVNRALETVRDSVRSRLRIARKSETDAERKLADLQSRREEGRVPQDKFVREEPKLRARLAEARSNRAELERALSAESPADLLAPGEREPEEDEDYNPYHQGLSSEFPGVSVPERLYMLFREARNPEAERPIAVSGIALAVLTAIVIGVVVISSAFADDTTADVVGRGEVLVPVIGENLSGVGQITFTLDYDEQVLSAVEVVPGVLSRARTVTSDLTQDGSVSIDIASTYGFDASGELILVVFSVDNIVTEKTNVTLSKASAFALDGGSELTIERANGWVDTVTFDVFAPVIRVT